MKRPEARLRAVPAGVARGALSGGSTAGVMDHYDGPPMWLDGPGPSAEAWIDDPRIDVAVLDGVDHLGAAYCVHRGADFQNDWVRELWVVCPPAMFAMAARRFIDALLAGPVTHLRWRVAFPVTRNLEGLSEHAGAEVVALAEDHAVYQVSKAMWEARRALISRKLLFSPSASELLEIRAWCDDSSVIEALGHDGTDVTIAGIFRYIYPVDPKERAQTAPILMAVRDRGLLGFAVEHDWHHPGDTIKEYDLALPNIGEGSPKTMMRILAEFSHRCFSAGGTKALVNVNPGLAGTGFPRWCVRMGAHDVSEYVTRFGRGVPGRAYYMTTPDTFYTSSFGARLLRGLGQNSREG